ncbi:hypothetical protein PEC301879_03050 [Pectobacterium carotovorum subsp. carotovorum]|nr:hypothetical protein PEC301879_03050 [Pectobacterium carotovorum subsp. carotovorum]
MVILLLNLNERQRQLPPSTRMTGEKNETITDRDSVDSAERMQLF